LNVEYVLTVD